MSFITPYPTPYTQNNSKLFSNEEKNIDRTCYYFTNNGFEWWFGVILGMGFGFGGDKKHFSQLIAFDLMKQRK